MSPKFIVEPPQLAEADLSDIFSKFFPEIEQWLPQELKLNVKQSWIIAHEPEDNDAETTDTDSADAAADETKAGEGDGGGSSTIDPSTLSPRATRAFCLEFTLAGSYSLADVPGIGPLLGAVGIQVDQVKLVGANKHIPAADLIKIDGFLEDEFNEYFHASDTDDTDLEEEGPSMSELLPTTLPNGEEGFPRSVFLTATVSVPVIGFEAKLTGLIPRREAQNAAATSPETAPSTEETDWGNGLRQIGQKFKALYLESVRLVIENGEVGLNLNAGVRIGPMDAQLLNFMVKIPLSGDKPSLDFSKLGIAIGYESPSVSFTGLLANYQSGDARGFQGGLLVNLNQYYITALGRYSRSSGDSSFHSFLLYGYLGTPGVGPPFLSVSGISLGIGFNTGLTLPPPERFEDFPLTAAALKPPGETLSVTDLANMMETLDDFIYPLKDNFWLAAGVKFESFKFLTGFLSVSVEFGQDLEIGLQGFLEANLPTSSPDPLIRLSIGFSAQVLPLRGIVETRGSFLPATFILHEDVEIKGGMAFVAITKDQGETGDKWSGARAGEYILTIGGYGPLYQHPKDYHPQVPLVELTWVVNPFVIINAKAYFALTPEAIYIGGKIQGVAKVTAGIVWASVDFSIALHFALHYNPLKYEGRGEASFRIKGGIEIDVGFFTIEKSLSLTTTASLRIAGPEFSVQAHLSLHFIVSFSIDISYGPTYEEPEPIEWSEFKTAFLPPDEERLQLSVADGIMAEARQRTVPTVNPQKIAILLDTAVPVKEINGKGRAATNFGVKLVGLPTDSFKSKLDYTVKCNGTSVNDQFEVEYITKNVPSALWMGATEAGRIPVATPEVGELIEDVACGFRLVAKPAEEGSIANVEERSISDEVPGLVGDVLKPTTYQKPTKGEKPSAALIAEFYPA